MEVEVEVTEILGSETFIHYSIAVPPVITPEIEELLADSGSDIDSLGDTTRFSSRISSNVAVRTGGRATVVVDTAKMHFFDPETGRRIGYTPGAYATA
jgi:multiple sugar transport system ATP-binding protein